MLKRLPHILMFGAILAGVDNAAAQRAEPIRIDGVGESGGSSSPRPTSGSGPISSPSANTLPRYAATWESLTLRKSILPVFDAAVAIRHEMFAVVGGFGPDLKTTPVIQVYHPKRGWQPIGSQMRDARAGHSMTELGDGRVLIVGGVQGTLGERLQPVLTCEVLDPLKAGSTFIAPLEQPLPDHTTHALGNGRVAIVGGDAVLIFDSTMMMWVQRITLAQTRRGHTSVLLSDGSIMVIGGDEEGTVEVVDTRSLHDQATTSPVKGGLWSPSLRMHLRELSAILLPDGRIFVGGGYDVIRERSIDWTWIIDPKRQTIDRGPNLQIPTGVTSPELFLETGLVVILGGEWATANDRGSANAARVYDPRHERMWSIATIPNDAARRMWFRTDTGRIGAFGGYRFISSDRALSTGELPGVHIRSDRFELRIRRVTIVPD